MQIAVIQGLQDLIQQSQQVLRSMLNACSMMQLLLPVCCKLTLAMAQP